MGMVLFVGTSALLRFYMWWSWRRRGHKAQSTNCQRQISRSCSQLNHPVSASLKPLQDPGLYAFVTLLGTIASNFGGKNENKQPILTQSVRFPYMGHVSMDVLLFVGSSLCFRIHLFWRGWWKAATDSTLQHNHNDSHHRNHINNNSKSRPPPDGRATRYKPHKDPHLYAFIDLTQQQRSQLKKVPDPEESRQERLLQLKEQQKGKPSGPLGICDRLLQSKRSSLKATTTSKESKQ
jgi:hypothetical protein